MTSVPSQSPVDEVVDVVDGLLLVGPIHLLEVEVVEDLLHGLDVLLFAAAVGTLKRRQLASKVISGSLDLTRAQCMIKTFLRGEFWA